MAPPSDGEAPTSDIKQRKGRSIAPMVSGGLFLLLALGYGLLQASLPAAGAVIIPNVADAWLDDGVAVNVLPGGAGEQVLQDGDVVTAIEGRALARSAPLVAGGRSDALWEHDESLQLTVRRGGETVSLPVSTLLQFRN